MGKLSGTPFPGEPEGSRQWLLLSAGLSTYYSIILLFQYFILGFFPCFSRWKECSLLVYSAHCLSYSISALDHFQHFIKISFAFLPLMDLPFLLQHGLLPCLLSAHMLSPALFLMFPTASDSVTVTDCPFTPVQPLSAPYFASRTHPFCFLHLSNAHTLTAFTFLSAKDLASFLAEMCHKKSALLPPWWWKSSCKRYIFVLQVVAKKCVIKSLQCHLWEHLKNNFVN